MQRAAQRTLLEVLESEREAAGLEDRAAIESTLERLRAYFGRVRPTRSRP